MNKITRFHIRNNPDTLFVFGDNSKREGYGGQAKEARGELNTFGLAVKWEPNNRADSYFSDGQVCTAMVTLDLMKLKKTSEHYAKLYIIPGIGTGLAKLPTKAPKLYKFLCAELSKIEKERK